MYLLHFLSTETIGQSIISGLRDLTDKVVEGQKPLQSAAVIALENHFGGDYKAVGSDDLTDTDSTPVVNTAIENTARGPVSTGKCFMDLDERCFKFVLNT